MNWTIFEGRWQQFKGKIRERWGELTDDDIEKIGGKKDRFLGVLKERYGLEKDDASREVDAFIDSLKPSVGTAPDQR